MYHIDMQVEGGKLELALLLQQILSKAEHIPTCKLQSKCKEHGLRLKMTTSSSIYSRQSLENYTFPFSREREREYFTSMNHNRLEGTASLKAEVIVTTKKRNRTTAKLKS